MEHIGRHYIASLKRLPRESITAEQLKQIEGFESHTSKPLSEEQAENMRLYMEKVFNPLEEVKITFDKKEMWNAFRFQYKWIYEKPFEVDKETLKNVEPIFKYFLRDKSFFECENLSDISKPSFDKGLLIVGGYGNGKSSVMNTIRHVLMDTDHSFAFKNLNDLVSEYEFCNDPEDKTTFWHRNTQGRTLFDDIKTERQASNYGKVNLFKDIIEKRYLHNNITHGTCNYRQGNTSNLKDAVEEIGEKYGSRVYDRFFEMFNVIEFKGKSRRV